MKQKTLLKEKENKNMLNEENNTKQGKSTLLRAFTVAIVLLLVVGVLEVLFGYVPKDPELIGAENVYLNIKCINKIESGIYTGTSSWGSAIMKIQFDDAREYADVAITFYIPERIPEPHYYRCKYADNRLIEENSGFILRRTDGYLEGSILNDGFFQKDISAINRYDKTFTYSEFFFIQAGVKEE